MRLLTLGNKLSVGKTGVSGGMGVTCPVGAVPRTTALRQMWHGEYLEGT